MSGVEFELKDGMQVSLDGRPYTLRVDPLACGGQRHHHPEPHAEHVPGVDGLPDETGRYIPHHHHGTWCTRHPRQLTLLPAWDVEPGHRHEYDADTWVCSCGAMRTLLEKLPSGRNRNLYDMPRDESHPEGWSYERIEEAGR